MNGDAQIRTEPDVSYGHGGDIDLKLDIYHPAPETSKRTAIIQLHGGGFRAGDRKNIAANCRAFAGRGYLSLASQYRLTSDGQWPAPLHDVKAAIRWTRANAQRLGIEPDRIVVAGYSAGALLSLIAAGSNDPSMEGSDGNSGVSSAVAACIAFYPPAQQQPRENDDGRSLVPAGSPQAIYDQASPLSYARAGAPPTILFHSTGDTTVPFEASRKLFDAYHDAGVAVELHLFDGLSHVFDRHPEFAAPAIELCDLFLDRHVVEPRVYPPFAPGVARPG